MLIANFKTDIYWCSFFRHSSDAFNNFETISISSLDDIVVAPPLMFDDPTKSPTSESNNQHQAKTVRTY